MCVETVVSERELFLWVRDGEHDSWDLGDRGCGYGGSVRPLAAKQHGSRDLELLTSFLVNLSLPSPSSHSFAPIPTHAAAEETYSIRSLALPATQRR